MIRNLGVFGIAAFEIAGCFAFWLWIRRGADVPVATLGIVSLIAFAVVLTRADSAFAGRAYGRREFSSRGISLCCGFWRDSAACGAVAQRSAWCVSVDVPVMRTATTHSGRGFMVQARFAGDGSTYLRRQ